MKYKSILLKAKEQINVTKKTAAALKKKNKNAVDTMFHQSHTKTFKNIDCLECANCCKTTSPIFRDVDIKRIAKYIKVSESEFISKNLFMDNEGDYVLKESPCLFLGNDNKCSIYEYRPLACKEYPHTDRKNVQQILNLSVKNAEICPAVSLMFDEINALLKK